jgi:hypothetical protein
MGVRPGGVDGGEGGIRTRDGLPRTAFPVRRHSPLGDLSRTRPRTAKPTGMAPAGLFDGRVCGGEGGIRTRGAFAHRFSRAAPSTTRTPLRGRGYQRPWLRPGGAGPSTRSSPALGPILVPRADATDFDHASPTSVPFRGSSVDSCTRGENQEHFPATDRSNTSDLHAPGELAHEKDPGPRVSGSEAARRTRD